MCVYYFETKLIGKITTDLVTYTYSAEIQTTLFKMEILIISYKLFINEKWKRPIENPIFANITCLTKLATNTAKYLKKNDLILINEGSVKSENPENELNATEIFILAHDIQLLTKHKIVNYP